MLDRSKTKVAACGRRWGKSDSVSIDVAAYALLCPGSIQFIYAPSTDQTRPLFDSVSERLSAAHTYYPKDVPKPKVRNLPHKEIVLDFPDGSISKIFARSLNETSGGNRIRGFAAHRAIVDETAYCPEKVISSAVRPQLADVGGQLILISTPCGKNHFYRAWLEAGAKYQFPSTQNPYTDWEWLQAEKEMHGEDSEVWRTEYLAEFVDSVGAVFNYTHIDRAQLGSRSKPLTNYSPEEGRRYVAGVDLANVEDYTVVAVLDVTDAAFVLVDFDRFHKLETWSDVVNRVEVTLKRWDALAFIDTSSMASVIMEDLQRRGCKCDGYSFNHHSAKRDLVANLVRKLDKNQLILPPVSTGEGELIADELRHFYYEKTKSGNTVYGGAPGKHDDIVIALMLANWRYKNWEQKEKRDEPTIEESIRMMFTGGYPERKAQRTGRRSGQFIRRR